MPHSMPMQGSNARGVRTPGHFAARFSVEPRIGLRACRDGGIVLDASRIDLGNATVAMVLVVDLVAVSGGRNTGVSATEAFPAIVAACGEVILDTLDVSDVLWIERDSLGSFDLVRINAMNGRLDLEWQPLLSGMYAGRTENDFVALFGQVAQRAMRNVRAMVCQTG